MDKRGHDGPLLSVHRQPWEGDVSGTFGTAYYLSLPFLHSVVYTIALVPHTFQKNRLLDEIRTGVAVSPPYTHSLLTTRLPAAVGDPLRTGPLCILE